MPRIGTAYISHGGGPIPIMERDSQISLDMTALHRNVMGDCNLDSRNSNDDHVTNSIY